MNRKKDNCKHPVIMGNLKTGKPTCLFCGKVIDMREKGIDIINDKDEKEKNAWESCQKIEKHNKKF